MNYERAEKLALVYRKCREVSVISFFDELHKDFPSDSWAMRGAERERTLFPLEKPKKGWFAYCQRCKLQGKQTRFEHASPYVVAALLTDHFEEEHGDECFFCYKKFDLSLGAEAFFRALAEHVNECHVSPEDREGRDSNIPKGWWNMPAPKPTRTGQGKKGPRAQYLKASLLEHRTHTYKSSKLVLESTDYSDVQLFCTDEEGEKFILGLRLNSENYATLYEAWGDDEKGWAGHTFVITPVYSEATDSEKMVVSLPKEKKNKA